MRKAILISTVFFGCVLGFSEVSAQSETITSYTILDQDTTWEDRVVIDGARVTVAQNATLTIKPGTIVSGKNGALLYVMGKLKAEGREDKKIRFSAEPNEHPSFTLSYYIDSTSTSEIDLENFILEKGGGNQDFATPPALTIRGKANLSKGIIRRNRGTALRVWSSDVTVEDSEIYEQSIGLENKNVSNTLKAEDNWWGSGDGPTKTSIPNSPRSYIIGPIDYDPWQKKGPIPIVILPGFGGSFSFKLLTGNAKDEWWLPTLGTYAYRYFAKALVLSNYYHDKDFYWGFYDWRLPCEESAREYLEQVIDTAKNQSGHSQVHLVAHSLGGLVARSYIESNGFRDDVDQLVMAGTPHLGASAVYPIWEGAELPGEKKPFYLYLWYLQALNRDWDSVKFIRKNFPSLGEMMPIYDFLKDSNGRLFSYANQLQKNPFLVILNDPENLTKLKRRVTTTLLAGEGEDTLEKIQIAFYGGADSKWDDGIPDPIDPPKDTTEGDGTVTVRSASGDGAITKSMITLSSYHSQLLATGTQPIFDQLKVQAKFPLLTKILSTFLLTAKGPVETIIKDGLGNILDSDNAGEDGVFQEQSVEGQKLLYAQSPQDFGPGEEKTMEISFKGEESGDLKAAAWNFSDSDNYTKEEIDNPVVKGMELNYTVKMREDSISVSPRISLKNMMVLVDRWYGGQKISDWSARRELINELTEAYQAQSNGHLETAQEKIASINSSLANLGLIQKNIVF